MNELREWIGTGLHAPLRYPLGILVGAFLLLAMNALWRRTYPRERLAWWIAGMTAVSFIAMPVPAIVPWILAADIVIFFAVFYDAWTPPHPRDFRVNRETQRVVSLLKDHPVGLLVTYLGRRPATFDLGDDIPSEFTADPPRFSLTLRPRQRIQLRYTLRGSRRGAFQLEAVHFAGKSRWGWWRRMGTIPLPGELHVYPDLRQLEEYALLARTNRLSLVGVRRARRIGQDHDFERLRDYTPDDNFKHIDWRATARRNRLTVKDFQTSQSQRVVFLIDCGRMMTNLVGGLSLLDHALNATLMLSYVALRQGDSVGMICFSREIHASVPPKGGRGQMNRLLHAAFDRFPSMVESRYDLAFSQLAAQVRRRALVVLITNVMDEVNAERIRAHLRSMVGKHLPLGILLRDPGLYRTAESVESDGKDVYAAAAAAEILLWRRRVLSELEHTGVLMLDAFPDQLTAPLVNRYLEIKAQHML